jgi:uncharacterized protein (DUF1501 family)
MAGTIGRRDLLRAGLGVACSAAASPLLTPVVHAAVPGENRLVVIVLRGALDGLQVVQPWGDPDFARLRPTLAARPGAGLSDLDGFFGLHDDFAALLPLWEAGELGFAHAVSTPYRDRRSHFDGQDLLENGGSAADGAMTPGRDGWLNRMLTLMPGARAETAIAVGTDNARLLQGEFPALSWSPAVEFSLADDALGLLTWMYRADPAFATALAEAAALGGAGEPAARESGRTLAEFSARMLKGESRLAAFSIGGWDTHRNQAQEIRRPARALSEALLTLKHELGAIWGRTAVIAVTEFGRTARENGSRGTDHGTGGVMLLSGGALSGARVFGRWPGLEEADLYAGRDVMPTDDVRRLSAWVLRGMFGLGRNDLERVVFPGLALGSDPGLLA